MDRREAPWGGRNVGDGALRAYPEAAPVALTYTRGPGQKVDLSTIDGADGWGEPESVESRVRFAGLSSSSTSECASWICARSFKELRRLAELAIEGAPELV